MDTADWKGKMIYRNDKGFDVGAMSDNERYFVLMQPVTTSSVNIFLADQQTKETKKINSEGAESNNNPMQFSMDNNSLFYTTDEGSDPICN